RSLHSFPTRRSSDLRTGTTAEYYTASKIPTGSIGRHPIYHIIGYGAGAAGSRSQPNTGGRESAAVDDVTDRIAGDRRIGNFITKDRKSTRLNSSHVA